ncbi:DUF2207 domain-containing protein [Candidatus Kaiserbacteria bacterium]|nr:DUF2207 domain-containing protein [Candidatus Kaiserbacteria bacterium]
MFARSVSGLRSALTVAILSASLWLALFAFVSATETITLFTSDIEIQADGDLLVTETITYDFGNSLRHGIYRNLSECHFEMPTKWYKERYTSYAVISVTRDGSPEPYTTAEKDGLSIKIGSATTQIQGVHTYEIVYRVQGALSNSTDGPELYWNVTGDEWQVTMQKVLANITVASGVALGTKQYCYAGSSGTRTQCSHNALQDGVAIFQQESISPGQQLTVAQTVSLLQPLVPLERLKLGFILIPFGVIALLYTAFASYRWRTRYKGNTTVVAQYEPYENFKPMFTGVLIDGRLDASDISAGIIYLAQQGFLKIRQQEHKILFFTAKDYEIELLRPKSEVELASQGELLHLLFLDANQVGSIVSLSELKKDMSRRRSNSKVISELKKSVVKDMVDNGFLEQRFPRVAVVISVFLVFIFVQISAPLLASLGTNAMVVITIVITLSVVLIYFTVTAERRTAHGYEALHYLKGFREFLSVTEVERYKFHNAPRKSPEQFMEFLPYAIAFKVEKEWAKIFDDLTISNPDWYEGNATVFSASAFTEGLGSFSTTFVQSSGSSGSSGSGSAGGGGGGGGGGSW